MSITRFLSLIAALLLTAASDESTGPRYTPDGALIPPSDYREWVYLSSGLDMSYSEQPAAMGHSMFDNVFVSPAAWAEFKRSGHWPDKTMFVMEARLASSKGSINKHGQFQTEELMGLEVHVRDEARFKGGWGFFVLSGTAPAQVLPSSAACYACHAAHGAVDSTFTQFYPTARPIAVKAGTFRAG
ncbi:MAG TPA: cytochrome P460 family protein [Steroidobacteraceae bacterium]|nr:cytochrome P460 family protein [Steroidobacteraceae bacterium]